ncbi:hypothetical protein ACN28S_29995 [Cystobacter fuscus]
MLIGILLQGLSPIIELLSKVLVLIIQPLNLLAGPILRGLFESVKYISIGILYVAKGIAWVWNGIIGAIQSVLSAIGNIKIFGGKPFDFLNDWADSLNSAKMDTDSLDSALNNLQNMTWEQAQAASQQAEETWKSYEANKKVNEALSNVPTAWKRALREFEAQDARVVSPLAAPA